MAKQSQAWKNVERKTAAGMGGTRHSRGADFSESAPDIDFKIIPGMSPKVDCKWSGKTWRHHTLLQEIDDKYCKAEIDVPFLVTKQARETGEVVSMKMKHFLPMFHVYVQHLMHMNSPEMTDLASKVDLAMKKISTQIWWPLPAVDNPPKNPV
jgi:hypothetical protein